MAGIADQFAGLPIEELIVSPIIGMAKGQAKLNEVTWKYISEVAFVKDEKTGKTSARSLDVEMNRVVTDGATGEQTIQKLYNKVPMLPLVPLPSLAITSADIEFSMEVKTSEASKDTSSSENSYEVSAGGRWWGMSFNAKVAGKVATNKENTRSTDNSAKYNVKVHAEQLPATEGMLKLSDYLTQMLEPSLIPLTEERNNKGYIMARLNVEELVGGLLEAAMVSQGISERQHINALRNYFNEDGTPKTTSFNVGGKDLVVPLYILADHSSIGLEELDIEFSCRLIFGDEDKEVSSLKKSLLGLFKKKGYEHNIKGIEVDSGFNPNETGMAKIKVKFKADEKPEAVSRLIDEYIKNLEEPSISK
jgi:hypothetical protein